jgi:hypothetical protein
MRHKKKKIKEIRALAKAGLRTDGEHHKQSYLEEILKVCGVDVEKLHKDDRGEWERGVPP